MVNINIYIKVNKIVNNYNKIIFIITCFKDDAINQIQLILDNYYNSILKDQNIIIVKIFINYNNFKE